jgi:hypothetical protein
MISLFAEALLVDGHVNCARQVPGRKPVNVQ